MQSVLRIVEAAYRVGRRLWPYLMLELVMPGGTLMALLLFLHRRGKLRAGVLSKSAPAVRLFRVHPCRLHQE